MTQFGRALDELNIDIIHANSPAAKGRVERANGVLQDRLVKEMRLRGIDSITSANEYVNEFVESYNKKFGKAARVRLDAHRPLLEHECLDDICTVREERKVGRQLTIRYKTCEILLEPSESSLKAQGQKVQIYERSEAAIEVQFKGEVLPQRPAESEAQRNIGLVVEQKRLTETLRKIRTRQAERDRQLLASGTLSERQEAVLANHLLRQEQNPWGAELR